MASNLLNSQSFWIRPPFLGDALQRSVTQLGVLVSDPCLSRVSGGWNLCPWADLAVRRVQF